MFLQVVLNALRFFIGLTPNFGDIKRKEHPLNPQLLAVPVRQRYESTEVYALSNDCKNKRGFYRVKLTFAEKKQNETMFSANHKGLLKWVRITVQNQRINDFNETVAVRIITRVQ